MRFRNTFEFLSTHLVQRRRVGREHLLSINPQPLDEAAFWIEERRAIWTSRLNALEALLRAEDRTTSKRPGKRGVSR